MNLRRLAALAPLVGLLAAPAWTAVGVPAAATSTPPAVVGATTRVDVATAGTQADGWTAAPTMSGDGRYVAFESNSSNLVAGDTNTTGDVFARDRTTGVTTLVSIAVGGAQANGWSDTPVISADGRYVGFVSDASNLVVGDTNNVRDVFLRDRLAGLTTRVSISTTGSQGTRDSFGPAISGDGRYVTFGSWAGNLVAGDSNGTEDVFVHDRVTGATTLMSVAAGGGPANSFSEGQAISGDGRYVAFASVADNLVTGDTNHVWDVFLRDRALGTTTRINLGPSGNQADEGSYRPAFSGDGRYVAYDSWAGNLVPGDTNRSRDVFVHDRATGATTRVSVASSGAEGLSDSGGQAMDPNGRYVTFSSNANNLVTADTNGAQDVFVHDLGTGITTRVSISTAGTQANRGSFGSAISTGGRYVAFASEASNLVPGDTNDTTDVFVRDRFVAVPSTPFGDFDGDGWSDVLARRTTTGDLALNPGNGTGTTIPVRIGTGWNGMSAITRHGDFDRDGHEDVIARDGNGALWLYPGTGARLTTRVAIGLYGWNTMREITAVGDLDGDAYPDLIAVQASTGNLYLYPGHGASFGARRLLGPGWNGMSELTGAGDLSGDGRPDLLARATTTGTLWLYPGAGSGSSTRLGTKAPAGTGWNVMRDLTGVGDFDRDGHVDLLAVHSASGRLFLYPGRGGLPGAPLGSPLPIGTGWTNNQPLL